MDIFKNLNLTFQALTKVQKNNEELIGQQLVMNLLRNEFNGGKFAVNRAREQQKNTYQVMGALASGSLVTMRAVLEALIYASFIFVFPLALLPGGFKFIFNWAWLTIWIQLWPPFYAILNYIMQSVAQGYSTAVFQGLSEAQKGLSLFTSTGLKNMYDDIFALEGYLSASVPFITYAILKGCMSSFVQLTGSAIHIAQNSASSAAAEQASGNYSFGNTSFGQISYENTTGFQNNMAPSLSSGYFADNQGSSSTIYGGSEIILNEGTSNLRTSLFSDNAISQSFQKQLQHAQSSVETAQKGFTESLSTHVRNTSDLTEHLANSQNYNESISSREAYDVQESARSVMSMAENWGKQYGFNTRESLDFLLRGSAGGGFFNFFSTETSESYGVGANRDEMRNSALNDEGIRLSSGYSQSLDEMKSQQEQKKYISGRKIAPSWLISLKLRIKRKASKIRIGALPLLKNTETQHIMITGGTGSGKTNCFHHILPQIRTTKQKAVIVDTTGILFERYFRKGKDILLNPLDERSAPWHPWVECNNKIDYDSLAECFIPQSHSEDENYWRIAARSLFSSVIQKVSQNQELPIWLDGFF